jgi:hypothetical protein
VLFPTFVLGLAVKAFALVFAECVESDAHDVFDRAVGELAKAAVVIFSCHNFLLFLRKGNMLYRHCIIFLSFCQHISD